MSVFLDEIPRNIWRCLQYQIFENKIWETSADFCDFFLFPHLLTPGVSSPCCSYICVWHHIKPHQLNCTLINCTSYTQWNRRQDYSDITHYTVDTLNTVTSYMIYQATQCVVQLNCPSINCTMTPYTTLQSDIVHYTTQWNRTQDCSA